MGRIISTFSLRLRNYCKFAIRMVGNTKGVEVTIKFNFRMIASNNVKNLVAACLPFES